MWLLGHHYSALHLQALLSLHTCGLYYERGFQHLLVLATVCQPTVVRAVRGAVVRAPEGIAEAGMDSHMWKGGKHGREGKGGGLLPRTVL